MSFTFAIDTASPFSSIAIFKDNNILAEYNFVTSVELSETLIPMIDTMLTLHKIEISSISLLGAVTGPGLFTGIRVGLSSLKGLFFGKNVPVVPVNTLKAVASKVAEEGLHIVPVLDARRGEIYTAVYKFSENGVSEVRPPSLINALKLKDFLNMEGPVCFTGSGAVDHSKLLKEEFPAGVILERSPFIASETGRIALQEFRSGNYLTGTDKLEPLYIRIPDAEKNLNAGDG